MANYKARITIKVTSPEIWNQLKEIDDYGLGISSTKKLFYSFEGEGLSEDQLSQFVHSISSYLGKEGIIIADTYNYNIDEYNYCIYYLGDTVRSVEFSVHHMPSKADMQSHTNIKDIAGWLTYGGFSTSDLEKEVLFKVGIAQIGTSFQNITFDTSLLKKVYLRETSFEGRVERIENITPGEGVQLIHSKSKYDPLRLEVVNQSGSLGYLPSDVNETIAPLLLINRLNYKAKVVELVRLSSRNEHAHSPIVAISIEAFITEN